MFIEHRTYTLKPGTTGEYFRRFGKAGLELNRQAADFVGWYFSEAGTLFQLVGIWRHENFAERVRKKAELYEIPEWRETMAGVQPLVETIESRFCVEMPFWHGRTATPEMLRSTGATLPFIEHRIYQLKPGVTALYLEHYGPDGFAIHETHAPCVGFYIAETGNLFQLISMWRFDSFEQRLERRSELNARPDWQGKMSRMSPLVDRIENKFLLPVPFWEE